MTGKIVKSEMFALLFLGGVLSGCAESSSEISPAFVSPLQYENLSCAQIQAEAQRVSSRATQAMGAQNTAAANDQATMAVTMILFWPAAFLLNGNDETRAEVARLKGELETLEQVNIMKNCGIEFQR